MKLITNMPTKRVREIINITGNEDLDYTNNMYDYEVSSCYIEQLKINIIREQYYNNYDGYSQEYYDYN